MIKTTWGALYQKAINDLQRHSITDYKIDAFLLMEHFFGVKRSDFLLDCHIEKEISQTSMQLFEDAIKKRCEYVPLQHITKEQAFYRHTFFVNEHVLIPRQDTENLVEEALKEIDKKKSCPVQVLDLCTGSGCIAISLKKEREQIQVVATDISKEALKVAKKNACQLEADITLLEGDLFEPLNDEIFDIIVTNPPYISRAEEADLMAEVKWHEPQIALFAEENGLAFYRRILTKAKDYLAENGVILMEIGQSQASDVLHMCNENDFYEIEIINDYAGHNRIIKANKNKKE